MIFIYIEYIFGTQEQNRKKTISLPPSNLTQPPQQPLYVHNTNILGKYTL